MIQPQKLLLGLFEEPIVVETILEAVDGNGNIITGDTTTSNDIVFNFSGTTSMLLMGTCRKMV